MRTVRGVVCLLSICCWLRPAVCDPVVLEDFEDLAGWKILGKTETFEKADTAAVGNGAIRVKLPGMVCKELSNKPIQGSAAWDRCEGLSFWVKGDGSDLFGCLAVGHRPQGPYTYVYYFPLKDTSWHKVTIAWADLVPEDQYYPIGAPGALPPSGIQAIRFGSRWTICRNNNPIPKHEYCIDQIQIEEKVEKPAPLPKLRPFDEVLDLLRAKKKLHVVCMGDSITAGTALPDTEKERYAVVMQDMLREWLGCDQIVVESRAVGGARLTDARAWAPRDFVGEPPDLVTILIGYNDKSGSHLKAYFKDSLCDYLDRIARQTQGKSAVLLLPTIPGAGPRFVMMDDFADAVRETAAERGLACFDLQKVFKEIGRDRIEQYLADTAHPNVEGHRLIADAIATFLVTSAGITTPKPQPKPKPVVAPGEAHEWTFEGDAAQWQLDKEGVSLAEGTASSGKQALKFLMEKPAADHRRAWSPLFAVSEGQRYRMEAKMFCADVKDGGIGVYVCSYPNAEGTGEPQIKCVKTSSNVLGKWETVGGDVTIPAGMRAAKVLIWSSKDSVGTFYADDVRVLPQ